LKEVFTFAVWAVLIQSDGPLETACSICTQTNLGPALAIAALKTCLHL